ncbi:serine hydrolase [Amycolatopsis sp. BJA-103]|uniref:serine hydrolase domain-containing protein n=1 Tax=Amycolatopsis sp. BJA-103 TaxID=1911175 RepID=UPI000C78A568|nr:serine hydrolase domain-containing protein [Amycolatopsis sp. BJA-103]AUI62794.1 D-alanyl-D-alanine carboxypeptidase [Amycolatopsis sp. BJA-103]PNE18634.1 D-alanyl-D-alanine carboxypeptidase [Amycolatopsis sp. BJA-103]
MRGTGKLAAGALAGVLLASVPAGTAAATGDPVRTAVGNLVAEGGFPGAVVQVRNGETVSRFGAGYANPVTREPAGPHHRFRIASNTKAFVAAVVLQLAGEGALSLDDSIERRLPGVVRGPGYEPEKITLRMLLNHTSGVHDPLDPHFFDPYLVRGNRAHIYPPSEVIRRSLTDPPSFAPGTKADYSNTGYLLLGKVIEKVTRNDVREEIQRRLLDPLGLGRTYFPLWSPFLRGPHLRGYDLSEPAKDMTVFSPSYDWTAGAMVSTVDELATFHRALLAGRLLEPAQQAELERLVPQGEFGAYGAGVETLNLPCPGGPKRVWGNTGAGPGFYSVSMSTEDGSKQIVLALNVYDLAKDVAHEDPLPSSPLPAVAAALC